MIAEVLRVEDRTVFLPGTRAHDLQLFCRRRVANRGYAVGVESGFRAEIKNLLHVDAVEAAGKKFLNADISQREIGGLGRPRKGSFDQRLRVDQVFRVSLDGVRPRGAGSGRKLLLRFTRQVQLFINLGQAAKRFSVAGIERDQAEQGILSTRGVAAVELHLRQPRPDVRLAGLEAGEREIVGLKVILHVAALMEARQQLDLFAIAALLLQDRAGKAG